MDFPLPELGEGVYEAELVSWLIQPGETIKRGQNLMEVLTDKATMEVPSPFAGEITALHVEPGESIKVGEVILSYEPVGAEKPATTDRQAKVTPPAQGAKTARTAVSAPPPTSSNGDKQAISVKAAPSVRLMARKLGIDIGQVRGTGPQGRVLVEDLTHHIQPSDGARKAPAPKPDYGQPGAKIQLRGLRRKIAENMVQSKRTIPHYGYVDECDVSELVQLRESLKEATSRKGIKLTYLAFVVKAAANALREVPIVNASLEEDSEEIILHDRYHIGVAVAAPQGLIVPVVKDADQKDVFAIAKEVARLSDEARTGDIRREDLLGGTFTVTSIGNIGGLFSTPVINYPQAGILGLGKVVKRPVFDELENVRPAHLMYLSFSFDHRVLDGAIGAAFGNIVIEQLQNPATLLAWHQLH